MKVAIKRVYAPPAESDGKRILVDRLWPRGLTKRVTLVYGAKDERRNHAAVLQRLLSP
jgi:uncharacterized protein YeaO (DUF488 family)